MPTTNYNFTTINGGDPINLVNAINTPLGEIDAKLKEIADTIPGDDGGLGNKVNELETEVNTLQSTVSTLQNTINNIKSGKTYNDINTNGFAYIANSD